MPSPKRRPTTATERISALPDWALILAALPSAYLEFMLLLSWVGKAPDLVGVALGCLSVFVAMGTTALTASAIATIPSKHLVDEGKWADMRNELASSSNPAHQQRNATPRAQATKTLDQPPPLHHAASPIGRKQRNRGKTTHDEDRKNKQHTYGTTSGCIHV